jgi:hypothetical protein
MYSTFDGGLNVWREKFTRGNNGCAESECMKVDYIRLTEVRVR